MAAGVWALREWLGEGRSDDGSIDLTLSLALRKILEEMLGRRYKLTLPP